MSRSVARLGEPLRRGCKDDGIRIEFCPPGRAHFGGHIQRLIGALMQYNDGSNEPSMGTSGLRRSRLP